MPPIPRQALVLACYVANIMRQSTRNDPHRAAHRAPGARADDPCDVRVRATSLVRCVRSQPAGFHVRWSRGRHNSHALMMLNCVHDSISRFATSVRLRTAGKRGPEWKERNPCTKGMDPYPTWDSQMRLFHSILITTHDVEC